jgi:replicative DNA helicase
MSSTLIDLTDDNAKYQRKISGMSDAASLLAFLDGGGRDKSARSIAVLPLGFNPLDRVLGGGLRTHDLLVLAGRPGVGKTVATLQMARNLALSGSNVVFACYEHDSWTLLTRLLAMEIGMVAVPHTTWYRMDGVRSLLDDVISGRVTLASASGDPLLRAARARIDEYAHRLHFVNAVPSATGLDELKRTVSSLVLGPTVLFVDYLQKVRPSSVTISHLEHIGEVTAGLKELALALPLSVVAVAAIGGPGLMKRRIHLPHLDAAVAVAYDADVVLMLNDKRSIVSTNNLTGTLEQAQRFRQRVVFSVEKNRGGVAQVDVEFDKDFEHFRFDPDGSYVAEQLIEDGEHDDFRL